MRRTIFFVIGATIVIGVSWYVAHLVGTVALNLGATSVAMPAPLAVMGLVVVVLAVILVWRTASWVIGVPMRLGFRRSRLRREDGDEAVTRTLVALAASDEANARRHAQRARRFLGDTPQTLLLAAEAERLAKREDAAVAIYKQLARQQDAALLGLRGLFRVAMNREAWNEAALIAQRAEAVHPGGHWLREEREELAVRTGNWAQALQLASPDAPRAAFAAAAADAAADPGEALRLAKQTWREYSGFVPAALAYARRLREAGQESRALDVIRQTWKQSPQPELAEFSLAPINNPEARLREAGRIAATAPNNPESRLLLAREYFAAGKLAEAREQVEAARAAGCNQRRVWILLADIEAAERGDSEAGRAAQRDALRQAAVAEPDPQWRCDVCGTVHAHWLASCPVCHTAGRIRWGLPRLAEPA